MKKMVMAMVIALAPVVAFAAGPKHTQGNYAACVTAADLDRFTSYSVKGDHTAAQVLLDSRRCVVLRPGVPVYLERVGLTTVEIRPEGQTITLFAPREAVR